MRRKLSTPDAVIAVSIAALVGAGIAFGGGGSGSGSAAGGAASGPAAATAQIVAKVSTIAHRVETIRGLRFKTVPRPLVVTPAQTRRDSLAELDRTSPPAQRRTDAQVLELLGLLSPGTDLRAVAGDVSGGQVAGYYDTRRKRLAVVEGTSGGGAAAEITLAHELDHALDDQRLGLRDDSSTGADDASSAYTALLEGTATAVMDDYTRRFIDPRAALGSAVAALGPAEKASAGVPPYIQSSLLFSYVVGEQFVQRLRSVGRGWKLVNYAFTRRLPVSTEQVIHPDKYLADERPVPVRMPRLRALVPGGWRRAAVGTIGEFDTDQLLRLGVPAGPAGDAAAGWGGGRYELWEPGGREPASCAAPCRSRSALVLSWAWDTPRDAAQFDAALPAYVARGLSGFSTVRGVWVVGDGTAAIRSSGLRTALVFAPSRALAQRLASGALGR
jgi:hypothetical protein